MLFRSLAGLVSSLLLIPACGSRQAVPAAVPEPPSAIAIAAPQAYAGNVTDSASRQRPDEICKIDPHACPSLEPYSESPRSEPVYAIQQLSARAESDAFLNGPLAAAPAIRKYGYSAEASALASPSPPPPPAPIPVKSARAPRVELFDVEAKVRIEVADIDAGRAQLVALTRAFDGQVMNEAVEDGTGRRGAALSLRIPSEGVTRFVARLGELGKLSSSSLETHEVSRKLDDAGVVERNLEQALARYEQLLAKAANVAEATELEGQLMRVRTELDRVRTDIEWTKDRVARSTVYVTLALQANHEAFEPVAKFYPGVRAALLYDVPASSSSVPATAFAGGGLSLQWTRTFDIDLDLLNSLREARGSTIDFYALTLGTAFYSDYFGGGKRRTLNPYFGFRTGYAHAPGQSLFPVGGSLGLELWKSEHWLFGVEARAYGMFGRKPGPDFAIEPALGLNLAY